MPDEIARLSEAMARDPGGMAWVALADALRRGRQLAAAERTALRGLERHPYHADGHDVLARIAADAGDLGRARDEWEMSLRLEPRHVGALLGLGWIALHGADRESAHARWEAARAIAPRDPRVVAVGRQLQGTVGPAARGRSEEAGVPASPAPAPRTVATADPRRDVAAAAMVGPDDGAAKGSRALFAAIEDGGARFALLVDEDGLVLAGRAAGMDGADRSDELGAELSGLSGEAERAMRQLQFGGWERLLVECEAATLALAPSALGSVTLVATPAGTPAGLPRLLLDRARRRANDWLGAL